MRLVFSQKRHRCPCCWPREVLMTSGGSPRFCDALGTCRLAVFNLGVLSAEERATCPGSSVLVPPVRNRVQENSTCCLRTLLSPSGFTTQAKMPGHALRRMLCRGPTGQPLLREPLLADASPRSLPAHPSSLTSARQPTVLGTCVTDFLVS